MGAFALIAAVFGLPSASASWGLALLFPGAILILLTAKHRLMKFIPIVGCLSASALPLTPSWGGTQLFGQIYWLSALLLLFVLAFNLAGYLRYSLTLKELVVISDRWMWLFFPLGYLILIVVHFGITYLQWVEGYREISFETSGWWAGLVSLGLTAVLFWVSTRGSNSIFDRMSRVGNVFNLNWLYRLLWGGFRSLNRIVDLISALLEGEGGILWIVVLMMILLAVFVQNVVGVDLVN
jgi:hypothetical protein